MKLKKTWMTLIACMLACIMVFSVVGCDDGTPTATGVTLDKTELTIATGESQKLTATATYSDGKSEALSASEDGLTWSSSDETVATVIRGVVSGKAKGTATITATYNGLTATCTVNVYSLEVQISETSATIEKGSTKTLTAKVLKDGAEQATEFEWTSSDANVASVDGGVVTALSEGTAKITAKVKGGSQSASCDVTVVWTDRPASYKEVTNNEENKGDPNTWHFWNDQGWNWTNSTVYEAYTEDYETGKTAKEGYQYIGANKMTICFEMDQPGVNEAAIQLIYRSSKETEGKLEQNHDYELTCKVETNVGGLVFLNYYTGDGNAHDEEGGVMLEAGKVNEITVAKFRHGDSGKKYANGIYDEVEAAIHMLLGNLEGRVTLSIYDLQYKDLGESQEKFVDDPAKLEGYVPQVEAPDLGDAEPIAVEIINDDDHKDQEQVGEDKGTYNVTASADKKSYDIEYTTKTSTYEYFKIAVDPEMTAKNNTFAVTVKNNGTSEVAIRFDLNGTIKTVDPSGNETLKDCVVSAGIAIGGVLAFDTSWGGTVVTVAGGATATIYLTYGTTLHGAPVEIGLYCNTQWYGNAESGWQEVREERKGNITVSDFTFANIVDPTQLPEGAVVTVTDADIIAEGDKAFFVLKGTATGVEQDALEAFLNANHFDFQQCGGAWTEYGSLERTVTVSDNGSWEIKFDVTSMPADGAAYTGHFGAKDPTDPTYTDNKWTDLKLDNEHAPDGKSVTVGGKKYSISNKVDGNDQSTNWGCVSLKIENA